MITFCPLWMISIHLSLTFQSAVFVILTWRSRWGLTCCVMSNVFSVPVPVPAGPSDVLLCVRMKMDTPQMTVWRESNLMSKEPVNLALVLSGLMAVGER